MYIHMRSTPIKLKVEQLSSCRIKLSRHMVDSIRSGFHTSTSNWRVPSRSRRTGCTTCVRP